MEQLTEESKAIIKWFEIHRDRCLEIRRRLGTVAAHTSPPNKGYTPQKTR